MKENNYSFIKKTIDWTKPLQTVHGLPARLVETLRNSPVARLCVVTTPEREEAYLYNELGTITGACSFNLINVPEKIEVNAKVYVFRCIKSGAVFASTNARSATYKREGLELLGSQDVTVTITK